MKNKILVFNGFYVPAKKYGGPTTSLVTVVDNCSEQNEFYIVAANHDFGETEPFPGIESNKWIRVGKAEVFYTDTSKLRFNKKELSKIIDSVKPCLIWHTGILTPYLNWPLAQICKKKKIPFLISPRGEVCENTFHSKYLKKYLTSCVVNCFGIYSKVFYHSTSEEETQGLKKYYKARDSRILFAPNIAVSLKVNERTIKKEPGEIRIVFISRIQAKKNLLTAVKAVKKMQGNAVFDIFGPMESPDYWQNCLEEMNDLPSGISINYCGRLDPDKVRQVFSDYHCFLFPTTSENYGHVIAESLSAGCPVVLSAGTTPWDDVDSEGGFISPLDDIGMFTQKLTAIQKMDNIEYKKLCEGVYSYYSKKIQSDNAVELHNQMFRKTLLKSR